MLPRVKIDFTNGSLGGVSANADGVAGLLCTAQAVSDTFLLGNGYICYKLSDLEALGINAENNALLYKAVKQFYNAAGEGAELWFMGVPSTVKPSEALDKDNALVPYGKKLLQVACGRVRLLAMAFAPAEGYEATITDGLDADVWATALNAQALAQWATNTLFAPLTIFIEARGYDKANITALKDLTTMNYNRVGIMIGDDEPSSGGAAVSILLGIAAKNSVQTHIGRVRDGALPILNAYIGDEDPAIANVETLHNKGYITLRTFTGKSGYFFTDDCLACGVSDDYRSIARRRTVDKAYRIAYATMLEHINEEIPITNKGYLVPSMVKAWESEMVSAIVNQMTSLGELGADPADAADNGVQCYIDPEQQIAATSRIVVQLKVKPFGYAKYIDVELGFTTINTEE